MNILQVHSLNKKHIVAAFQSKFSDKEDAINHFIAKEHRCDFILTRNTKHFKHGVIESITPSKFLLNYS